MAIFHVTVLNPIPELHLWCKWKKVRQVAEKVVLGVLSSAKYLRNRNCLVAGQSDIFSGAPGFDSR
jgi:hypothetical protein